MISLVCFAGLSLGAAPALEIQYDPKDGAFLLKGAQKRHRISLKEDLPKHKGVLAIREGNHWLVWDKRGLTVRNGNWSHGTRLGELAVSPKLFPKEEILANLEKIKAGQRKKEAMALSGYEQVGEKIYLLARWEEKGAEPWLETLMSVDLAQDHPKPVLIGRLAGFSTARGLIDDKLFLRGGKLAAMTRQGEDWGITLWDEEKKTAEFKSFGKALVAARPLNGGNRSTFIERTNYGSFLYGVADLGTGQKTYLLESRKVPSTVFEKPLVVRLELPNGSMVLRNVESGLEQVIPADTSTQDTPEGLLVWTPRANPVAAWLYEPTSWGVKTSWKPKSALSHVDQEQPKHGQVAYVTKKKVPIVKVESKELKKPKKPAPQPERSRSRQSRP